MRRWWLGFLAGVILHWLFVFLGPFASEAEILVSALSPSFQYAFLSVTTFLWGILGGTILTLWGYSRKMKAKGLIRRYFASSGFLVGALCVTLFLILFSIFNLLELQFPKWFEVFVGILFFIFHSPFFIFLSFLGILGMLFFPRPNFLTRGFFYDPQVPESEFVGYGLLTLFVLLFSWAIIGGALGYLSGLFKEKLFLKKSGNGEEKD